MKIIYGTQKINSKKDFFYINESDLVIDSKLEECKKVNEIGNQVEESKINGIRVSNLFKFNDYSLWWFMFPSFSATLRRISSFIDRFEETVEKIDPDGIYVENDFEKIPIIKQICEKKNIDLQFSKTQFYFYNLKKNLKLLIQPYRFQRITKEKTKKRISLFKKKYSTIESFTNKIIFSIPTAYRRYNYNPKLKKSIRGEYIQGSIIEILKKMNYDVSCIDLDYTFKGQHNILEERLSELDFWAPIESLVENNSSKNYFQNFIREYQKTIQNKSFKKLFRYKGINFWEIIKYDFQSLSNYTLLPTYIQLIEGLTDFLKNNKPKAVFLPYEVGPLALAIIIACKRNNILTIGLQHGMIWGDNPDYGHKNFRSTNNLYGMPLPDYFFVFGDFAKRTLIQNNNYPEEKLVVFGNAAFFNTFDILYETNKTVLKEKYNIPENKKIILLTTSKDQRYYLQHAQQNYDEQLLEKLLDKYAKNPSYHIILKPHPGNEYTGFYEELIKKYDAKNFQIIQGDIIELLCLSDVVVSAFSTTLIDSVAIGKMTLRVAFQKIQYPIPFDDYGVVLVCELDSIEENIERLIFDSQLQKELLSKRELFLKDQYNLPNKEIKEQLKILLEKSSG